MINSGLKLKDVAKLLGRDAKELAKEMLEWEVKRASVDNVMTPAKAASMLKDGEQAIVQYVSTACVDRDGDILVPSGCVTEEFLKSPSVFWGHDYGQPPIGSDEQIGIDDVGVWAKTVYAGTPRGKEMFQLRKEGHLRTSSVGFIPLKTIHPTDTDWDLELGMLQKNFKAVKDSVRKASRIIKSWLLLEHSDVGVPANPEALTIAVAKAMGLTTWDTMILKDAMEHSQPIVEMKPMPNEHTARQRNPDDFVAIAQLWDNEGIRAIGGKLKNAPDGASEIQSLHFKADKWAADAAKKWLADHKYSVESFEVATGGTENPSAPPAPTTPPAASPTPPKSSRVVCVRRIVRREIDTNSLVLEAIEHFRGKVD